jgi:hypothetical protein
MSDNLRDVVAKFIADNGIDALDDHKRVRNYLSDYAAKESKAARNTIVNCLRHGFHIELRKSDECERWMRKNRLVQRLRDEYGTEANLCKGMLETLETVMFGTVSGAPQEDHAELSTDGDDWESATQAQPVAAKASVPSSSPIVYQPTADSKVRFLTRISNDGDFKPIAAAYNINRRRIVSGDSGGTIETWNAIDGRRLASFKATEGQVCSVAYSPDGLQIVSGDFDGTIKIWDANGIQKCRLSISVKDYINSLAYSPYGRSIASGDSSGTIKIWGVNSRREIISIQTNDSAAITSVAYSPDGKRIVSGDFAGTIKIWDANSGSEIMSIETNDSRLTAIAYSPDGKRIVSGDFVGTIRVWDANSGKELISRTEYNGAITSIAYSPDEQCIFYISIFKSDIIMRKIYG